jgi:tetratricopeptide (TPR) repeat protein
MKRAAVLLPIVFALLLISACSPSPERLNNRGNRAFEQQDYETALKEYLIAQAKLPERAEPGYNAANTHYRQNDYLAAQQRLLGALETAGAELAQLIYYNLGNIFYQTQQYDQAVESYKQALRLTPDDLDAKVNLELALSKQQEQQAQNEQPQETGEQQEQNQTGQAQEQQTGIQPAPAQQAQPLTAEQARRLLEDAAGETQSLQQYLHQIYQASGGPPAEDW